MKEIKKMIVTQNWNIIAELSNDKFILKELGNLTGIMSDLLQSLENHRDNKDYKIEDALQNIEYITCTLGMIINLLIMHIKKGKTND